VTSGDRAEFVPRTGAVLGEFLLGAELGRGSQGAIFSATRQTDGRRFAVKVLLGECLHDSNEYKRFLREAQATARVKHPNLVEVFSIGNDRGVVYFSMEFLEGESLASRIKRGPVMTLEEVADFVVPVAMALMTIHSAGLVHRDLKPANLFLSKGTHSVPIPKVLDLGIVKELDPGRSLGLTHKDLLLGTPVYMSPEQLNNASEVNAQSDQFALGAVLHECLVGTRLFSANNKMQLVYQLYEAEIKPLIGAVQTHPEVVLRAITRMLDRDPEKRFASMREVARVFMTFASPATREEFAEDFDNTEPVAGLLIRPSDFAEAMLAPLVRPPPLTPHSITNTRWNTALTEIQALPLLRPEDISRSSRTQWFVWASLLVALMLAASIADRDVGSRPTVSQRGSAEPDRNRLTATRDSGAEVSLDASMDVVFADRVVHETSTVSDVHDARVHVRGVARDASTPRIVRPVRHTNSIFNDPFHP
jgi:serine/threonine protein kinase